jgi:hypothetical protein
MCNTPFLSHYSLPRSVSYGEPLVTHGAAFLDPRTDLAVNGLINGRATASNNNTIVMILLCCGGKNRASSAAYKSHSSIAEEVPKDVEVEIVTCMNNGVIGRIRIHDNWTRGTHGNLL